MNRMCRQCNVFYYPNSDVPFIILNPEIKKDSLLPIYTKPAPPIPFCSTICMLEFISNEKNKFEIALLEPEQIKKTLVDPLKYSVRTFLEYRHGRIGCFHCSFCHDEDNWVSMKERGPFCFVAGYPFGTNTVPFCSGILCLQEYCRTHSLSAQNNLLAQKNPCCVQCKRIYNPKQNQIITGMIILNENEYHDGFGIREIKGHAPHNAKIYFCSAHCIATYLSNSITRTKLYYVKKTAFSELKHERCTFCKKNVSAGAIALSAPYGSLWDSIWGINYFCSPECIVQAFFIDDKEMKKYGIGPWYTIKHE